MADPAPFPEHPSVRLSIQYMRVLSLQKWYQNVKDVLLSFIC